MIRRRVVTFFVFILLMNLAALVRAQSTLQGAVKDTSGGVLPGVVVEATSPALIEGTKSTTTDESGSYRIIDLRPGLYVVTFTLSGFQPVKVEAIELSGDSTRSVNAEMKLGTVSEALTVTSALPLVDVQNAVRVTSLDRQAIDNLPVGNNIWEMAQMIPGIDIYASFTQQASSVGGSYGATQVYMSTHGMTSAQNVVMVDGMTVSGLELNGTVQAYFNNDMNSEVTYQTSGISADRSGGGVTVNMIPREGGNRFSGDAKFSLRPNAWISDNVSGGRLEGLGMSGASSLRYLADETFSLGGPIVRSKLWFFGSYHQFDTSDFVSGTLFDNGEQGYDDQRIRQGSGRLTYQASSRNKLTGYYDRTDKTRANEMGTNDDPETASSRWTSPNYSTGNIKLTSTMTNRLLFEGGYSFNREYRDTTGQEGIAKERGTPEWYAQASRTLNATGARIAAPTSFNQEWPGRDNFQGSVSYATGAHQFKAGAQWQMGSFYHNVDANADLTQRYTTQQRVGSEWLLTTPVDVIVRNTPVQSQDSLNADIGVYAQDSWRIRRLTVNAGLRWEHINGQNDPYSAPEGRFAPARSIQAVTDVPNWYDWAPRLSMVYDVFGDARTAVKYSINRYNRSAGTAIANGFNTLSASTRTLPWNDTGPGSLIPDVAEGGRTFTYNPDGTLSGYTDCVFNTPGCDIDLATLNAGTAIFGTPAANDLFVGYPRTWNLEQAFEVQHALTRRLSITGSYTRGADHDLTKTVNQFRQAGDYTEFTIFNPIDGTPFPIYGIKDTATRTRLAQGGANVTYTEPLRESIYEQYAIEYRMRPYAGAQIFGGFTMDRSANVDCQTSVAGFVVDPNDLRFCDDFNLSTNGLMDEGGRTPWAKDFRLGVSMPLPWYGVTMGVSYLNNDSGAITPTYSIVPGSSAALSTRYPDGISTPGGASATRKIANQPAPACPAPCPAGGFVLPSGFILPSGSTLHTVNLTTGSSVAGTRSRIRRERLNQVDLKVSKTFRFGAVSVLPTFEAYNLFNDDNIFGWASGTFASSVGNYLVPAAILQGRILGFGAQVRW